MCVWASGGAKMREPRGVGVGVLPCPCLQWLLGEAVDGREATLPPLVCQVWSWKPAPSPSSLSTASL